MVDTTASRLGQVNATGTDFALFLKVFSGEVLDQFEEKNVMKRLQTMRSISQGQSAQFPILGKAAAAYHAAGENILDPANGMIQAIKHNERVINIDDLLVAPVFIDKLDEARNHYDVRSPYAQELGRALAEKFDRQSLQMVALAARGTTNIAAGGPDEDLTNADVVDADFQTNGASAVATAFQIAQEMDENHLPPTERAIVVTPGTYYGLVQQTDLLNRDFGGANGVFSDGSVMKAAGLEIVSSTHLPDSVIAAEAGQNNTYDADFSLTLGLALHKSAIGTVQLLGMGMESEYKLEYQGWLFVAKVALGSGILRPESAWEITSA